MWTIITVALVAYILGAMFPKPVEWTFIHTIGPLMYITYYLPKDRWDKKDWTTKGKIIQKWIWIHWVWQCTVWTPMKFKEYKHRVKLVTKYNKAYHLLTDEELTDASM